MVEYGALPPEINSARAYAGPQSAPLTAAAAAWQALAANLESNAVALNSAITALLGTGWQGPSSAMMAAGGAENMRWLLQAAAQAQATALAAEQAALAIEAAYAGSIPPPVIEANRNLLEALISSNVMGCNAGPIAACVAQYEEFWSQDATTMYGFSSDAAGVVGLLVPFIPPTPTVNPGGFASQAASVAQAGGTAAGQVGQNAATAGQSTASMGGGNASSIMSMAPQFMSAVPQALQGLAQPLMGGMGNPMQSLGAFQGLLSPFMSMMNPTMGGIGGTGALTSAASALGPAAGLGSGLGGGGMGALSAGLGGARSLGGLSVPATWAASAQTGGVGAAPISATGGASGAAAPSAASGGMGAGGAAPMAAMQGRENSSGDGPSYGAPVRVLPRPR